MYTLGRGVVHGGAFGLAVAAVDAWLRAAGLFGAHDVPAVREMLHGAALTVGLGMVLGFVCAWPLRQRRYGLLLHRVTVALAWTALAATVGGTGAGVRPGTVLGPVVALPLLPVADWLGFRWRLDPVLLGVLAIGAGIAVPALGGH